MLRCEVLIDYLRFDHKRPKVGDVIEMPDAVAADAAAKGYVKILPAEAAETGDAGDDGQGGAGTPSKKKGK